MQSWGGGSSLTRSHPVINVWECLWNIDECVMKQSRQTPSDHWAKKDTQKEIERERNLGCMQVFVFGWPLTFTCWGRKGNYMDSWTMNMIVTPWALPCCYNSLHSSGFRLSTRCWTCCRDSLPFRHKRASGMLVDQVWLIVCVPVHPKGVGWAWSQRFVWSFLYGACFASSCWDRKGTKTNCWEKVGRTVV